MPAAPVNDCATEPWLDICPPIELSVEGATTLRSVAPKFELLKDLEVPDLQPLIDLAKLALKVIKTPVTTKVALNIAFLGLSQVFSAVDNTKALLKGAGVALTRNEIFTHIVFLDTQGQGKTPEARFFQRLLDILPDPVTPDGVAP